MYKKVLVCFIVAMFNVAAVFAQMANTTSDTTKVILPLDSLSIPVDSALTVVAIDTLTPQLLKMRTDKTLEVWHNYINSGYGFSVFSLKDQLNAINYNVEKIAYQAGDLLPKGEIWVLGIIGFLLVLFAILKNTFAKQLNSVVQSFYSNRALTNLNKEDNLITSWSFLLLFIQFGFTIGMFLYLAARFKSLAQVHQGFEFFVSISIGVILLYLLKIVVLRIIGFIFDVQKPMHQYISILYLSYFNTSLLFVPIIIAFALSPVQYGSIYVFVGLAALVLIFIFQFIRAAVNILSHHRFPKLYLFLYFCTLEICPILILIKAIGL